MYYQRTQIKQKLKVDTVFIEIILLYVSQTTKRKKAGFIAILWFYNYVEIVIAVLF